MGIEVESADTSSAQPRSAASPLASNTHTRSPSAAPRTLIESLRPVLPSATTVSSLICGVPWPWNRKAWPCATDIRPPVAALRRSKKRAGSAAPAPAGCTNCTWVTASGSAAGPGLAASPGRLTMG